MAIAKYDRGNRVFVDVEFADANGDIITPPGPKIYFTYYVGGVQVSDAAADMVSSTNGYEGYLDTGKVDANSMVYWTAKSSIVAPESVKQGCFAVIANDSNPQES